MRKTAGQQAIRSQSLELVTKIPIADDSHRYYRVSGSGGDCSMTRLTAGIVGAGIAGASAGLALRAAGYDVTLFEQASVISPIGAALSIWGNAVASLRELGAADRVEAEGQRISRISMKTAVGKYIMAPIPPSSGDQHPPAFLLTRAVLQAALLDSLGNDVIRLSSRAKSITQDEHQAVIRTEDEEDHRFDLVVAADGARSKTGEAIAGNPLRHAAYGGFVALSDSVVDDSWPVGEFCEYWGRGERAGIGDLGGGKRYWYYLRNEASSGQWNAMSKLEVRDRLRSWNTEITKTIDATPQERLIPFSVHSRGLSAEIADRRIVCVGDAAHPMHPNLGQGACQGIEDALALRDVARVLTPDQVGSVFSALRIQRVRKIVQSSARIGHINHSLPGWTAPIIQKLFGAAPQRASRAMLDELNTLPNYAVLVRNYAKSARHEGDDVS